MQSIEGTITRNKISTTAMITWPPVKVNNMKQAANQSSYMLAPGLLQQKEEIFLAALVHFKMMKSDLMGPSRKQNVTNARHVTMYAIHKYCGVSYKDIGRFFNGKDHTTVISACDKIKGFLKLPADNDDRLMVEQFIIKIGFLPEPVKKHG